MDAWSHCVTTFLSRTRREFLCLELWTLIINQYYEGGAPSPVRVESAAESSHSLNPFHLQVPDSSRVGAPVVNGSVAQYYLNDPKFQKRYRIFWAYRDKVVLLFKRDTKDQAKRISVFTENGMDAIRDRCRMGGVVGYRLVCFTRE